MQHFILEQAHAPNCPPVGPYWDGRRLYFDGRLLAEFSGAAHVIGDILNQFDERGWPRFIEVVLEGGGDHREQLHNALKNLNRKLRHSDMRFYLDRTGTRIHWEPIPKS